MIAFAYVSLTIIVALTIPLGLTLDRRARAEFERENIIRAGSIAQDIGAENLAPDRRAALQAIVRQAGDQVIGRVIVVDASGALVADSLGPATGELYATSGRPEIVAALGDTPTSVIRNSEDLGVDIMATAVPIVDETPSGWPAVVGAVRITQSMDAVDQNVRHVTLGVIAIGVGGLVAGLILAVALSASLSRPLRRLADVAQRFGSRDLSIRAGAVRGPAEVTQLAAAFDRMAERVEAGVRAQDAFVANASHQLRTPLTGMKLRLEAAIADTQDDEMRRELVAAEGEVDRLSAIVTGLLAMAAGGETERAALVDLRDLAERAGDRWRAPAARTRTRLTVAGGPARAIVHATDVAQILDNVLDNALAYAPGPVEIATGHDDGRVWVAVRDHGHGMPEETRARVTERFYRAPGSAGAGSGLGLAIASELAARDGGALAIESAADGGTRVEVSYPVAEA